MLPTNILYRTFFIQGARYGTAFTIDVDDRQLLITAKHLLHGDDSHQCIRIYNSRKWRPLDCTLLGIGAGMIDVAVLALPRQLNDPGFEVTTGFGGSYPGQDVFFAGFPYKMQVDYGEWSYGHPTPFIKKGAFSAYDPGPPKAIYVDAINNEGFSGAALYCLPPTAPLVPQILGIVSKYKIEYEQVLDSEGDPTGATVPYNTGFLVAYSIDHALEIAKAATTAR